MNNGSKKIAKFTDLDAWQLGHSLVLRIYRITKNFPKEEQYGLSAQMRRSAVSITSNIAEGFSRPSYRDKSHFYSMSLGSVTELHNQIIIARDIGYLDSSLFDTIEDEILILHKVMNGLIKKSNTIAIHS